MAIIYQVPQFYCRGSLANETMVNLTNEQKEESMELALKIAANPEMIKHKQTFFNNLGKTIKGDYKDWRDQACKQDYLIAIWRGVCILLYHHKYSFKCEICGATTYISKGQKKPLEIQSKYTNDSNECPSCKCTKENGESPIIAIKKEKMYDNPWDILTDDEQLCKFFGYILNNTFKQQLRENPIKSTTRNVQMTDYADINIMKDLEKILHRFKIGINKIQNNKESHNIIYFETNTPPSDFVGQILSVRRKAEQNGVLFKIINNGIELQRTPTTKTITTTIEEKINISMVMSSQGPLDAPDILETINPESDHSLSITTKELIENIINILPTDHCKSVLGIKMECGADFIEHQLYYGDKKPTAKSICELLNITKTEYDMCMAQIKAAMIYFGFVPYNYDVEMAS